LNNSNKGGLLCDVGGELRGFVPLSHLDSGHFAVQDSSVARGSTADLTTKLQPLVGQILKVRVIEVDQSQNRLVLSEKDAEYEEIQKRVKKFLGRVKIGEVLAGRVSGIMPFGIFVDVGTGVEGLVHISEISWDKVSYPGQLFTLGDEVKVKVLTVSEDENRLSLSIKALSEDPWKEAAQKYPVGSTVKGRVSKVMPFGAFVTLEPGLDGLVHVSETVGPLEEGEEVEARVLTVDGRRKRLGLSLRPS
ncbi:S1 RNA-binding domain-containing protein, partial [Candidatus Parcubacteria bacterium]|nr:S1 RNA-binding domain-containing protein [Candidatus Parcubacteria bacterium]